MSISSENEAVRTLFHQFINYWNQRDAKAYAGMLTADANLIGFDGSQMNGPGEVKQELEQIFQRHQTAFYVTIERELRFLAPEVALLRAVAGMVPPGKDDIKPDVNAIQSMIATKKDGEWRIALFQNTPAAFHGRPGLAEQLTEELRRELERSRNT